MLSTRSRRTCSGDGGIISESRVAFFVPPGLSYVATLWGIWLAGGVAVPLGTSYPKREIAYVVDDSGASTIVADPGFKDRLPATQAGQIVRADRAMVTDVCMLPKIESWRRALMLYTSGTTSRAKGVVIMHDNLRAMVTPLVDGWGVGVDDRILHAPPLHHAHGIVGHCFARCGPVRPVSCCLHSMHWRYGRALLK